MKAGARAPATGVGNLCHDRPAGNEFRSCDLAFRPGTTNDPPDEQAQRQSEGSLLQTIREESTTASLPAVTFGNLDKLAERNYRERCIERLMDIILDLPRYFGTGRLFIP